jgi:hypothetical protein
VFVLLSSLAFAQTPTLPPGFDLSQFTAPVRAESRWVVTAMTADRFPDTTGGGPELAAGDRVELIVEENGRARIKSADRYGWVSASALTTTPPAPTPAPAPGPAP